VSGWFKLATHVMSKIAIFLTATGLAGAIGVAGFLIWRKLYREFPFFLSYICSSIIIPVVRVSVSGNYRLFAEVYWFTEIIYALLALLALHEAFRHVFIAFFEKWWFWLFFPCIVAAISSITALYRIGSQSVQANKVISLILSFVISVNLVQVLLFALFFALVAFHSIRWRNYPFGIVVGFAAIAVGTLGGSWAVSEFGTRFNILWRYAPSVAYIFATFLWLVTFIRPPDPEPKWTLEITPQQLLEEVRQYTKFFERFLGKRK
jgi:hypothetical protein